MNTRFFGTLDLILGDPGQWVDEIASPAVGGDFRREVVSVGA